MGCEECFKIKILILSSLEKICKGTIVQLKVALDFK